ncbi:MAG: ParB/RepB/Spo0J family partition protein [Patescibacteria group bacterium]|jgi:ParB family chromosome partitioning protein
MATKGLGRGLDSLIPKKIKNQKYVDFDLKDDKTLISDDRSEKIIKVNPRDIKTNPYQPRKDFDPIALNDLINSIKEHGIIQPLIVSKVGDAYELVAGERRLRSALELEMDEVPVIVRDLDDQKKLEIALIENLQRENLNPIESAIAYNQLMNEFNLSQEELSERLGKPRSSIANALRFLSLPEEIKNALAKRQITESHAKYLSGLEGSVKQLNIFRKIIYNNLSVRETSDLIKKSGGTKKAKVLPREEDQRYLKNLENYFGTKIALRRSGTGGKLEISFYNDEDLKEIMRKIIK